MISSFFTVFQAIGLYRYGIPDRRSVDGLHDYLPTHKTSLVEGLSITMGALDPWVAQDGSTWHQYSWEAIDEDGYLLESTIGLHLNGSPHAMSPIAADTSSLLKRSDTLSAYYSWVSPSGL